jgi:hypothetical protein
MRKLHESARRKTGGVHHRLERVDQSLLRPPKLDGAIVGSVVDGARSLRSSPARADALISRMQRLQEEKPAGQHEHELK